MSEKKASEFQREIDAAVRDLERRLRPWAPMMADPHAFAATYVADLRAQGWRPPLAPPPDWKRFHERPSAEPNKAYLEERRRMSGRGGPANQDRRATP